MSEEKEFELDPRVEKEVDKALSDEDIVGSYMKGGGNEERIPVVRSWLPDSEQWQGKTIITKDEAIAHARAKNLAKAFPEIKPLEEFLESTINDLEMLLTSVEGRSRDQQMEVIRGMFGAGKVDEEEARSRVMTAIAGSNLDKDEND